GCALGGSGNVDRHPAAGTRRERGGDPHCRHPRLPGMVADPELAVTHLRVCTLRDIEMAEHSVELADHSLPSAPCAHSISLLGVTPHPRAAIPARPATGR